MAPHPTSPAAPALPARPLLAGPLGWLLAALAGAATGWSAASLAPERLPDAALRLAAIVSAPQPILLLGWLTTPADFRVRAWLGESGPAALLQGLADVRRLGWIGVAGAAAGGAVAAARGLPPAAAWTLAATLALGVLGTLAATAGALLLALRVVAAGGNAAWTAISGGSNFGPQETAPLLYAPGIGWIAGLVPAAVLSAFWAARPELLSVGVLAGLVAAGLLTLQRLPDWALQQVSPLASRALQAAATAHELPFAVAQITPAPSVWLGADRSFVALVFSRWHGAPWLPPLGLAAALALALDPQTPPWLVAIIAAAGSAWSPLRAAQLTGLEEDQAARWLGATSAALAAERRALALRLGAGSGAVLLLGAVGGSWLVVATATVVGAAAGLALASVRPSHRAPQLALALALAGAVLAPVATPTPHVDVAPEEPHADLVE